jgi:serine/threonine-protein kinase
MGQVYRARDTKLNRDVALKVLPDLVAADPERLARFRREAQVLASLNHPHIAQIYGFEDSPSGQALVMELVEGDDLSTVIARGPLPSGEAIPIARQIAEALEAAHEQGIIHRDLKPANVKLRADGTVKVLDFGLAKALAPEGSIAAVDAMNSPTLTNRATQLGMILGTAAYMAPEQAKGRPVDRRADIWAFGVVLYEMLSGRRAFEGEDVSETLAAVLTRDPDFSAVPPSTPTPLVSLMRRCLERDPKRRLRDIGEARIALDSPMMPATPTSTAIAPVRAPRAGILWPISTALVALALVGMSVLWWRATRSLPAVPVRAAILLPREATFDQAIYSIVAISPDGTKIALAGSVAGLHHLYVRHLTEFEPRLIEGTDDATSPFFSPDGLWIGFFAGGKLKKVSADGGPVISLADAPDNRGGVWTKSDTIVFAPSPSAPVYQIPAGGGAATPLSTLDEAKHERTHRWPAMLPDGKTVIVTVGSVEHPDDYDDARIEAVRMDTGERHVLVAAGRVARYASTGHLLFLRGKVLYAVPFDINTGVAGKSPVPVIDGVSGDVTTGAANYAVSESGAVVFVPGDPRGGERKLAWVNSQGMITPIDVAPAFYSDPRLSPDGHRVAIAVEGNASVRDLYVIDSERGTSSQLTSGGENRTPVWLPKGERLLYVSYDRSKNVSSLMTRAADGSGTPDRLVEIGGQVYIDDVAKDGAVALLSVDSSTAHGRFSVFKIAIERGATPVIVATSVVTDVSVSSLSPNGQWVAYSTGGQVFVQSFATGGGRSQVSVAGGAEPKWSPDGRTLYYAQGDNLMAVPLEPGNAFVPGKPRMLFGALSPPITDSGQTYAVAPSGNRFLMLRPVREAAGPPEVRLILNWFNELRR